jgi:hypothetical protein
VIGLPVHWYLPSFEREETATLIKLRGLMRLTVIWCTCAMLAGCSLKNPRDNPFTVRPNADDKPTVWNCSVVSMGSPPRYACSDNKTYTAFQLRDFRLDANTPAASK